MSETTENKKYKLTDEHRAQLKPWADKWIANAMSTEPMSADDKMDCLKYVKEMYKAAGLELPKHILFVPSPFAASVAGGFAAAISELGDKATTTIPKMLKRVLAAGKKNKSAGESKWFVNPYEVKKLNEEFGLGELGIECVKQVHNMWNGGNQWSGWISYISFFRHVVKLDIDYSKWNCYEKLAELSGPRVIHKDFCIVSDRPTSLTVNPQNRPHNDKAPFCEWSDGSALYSVNGVRVPAFVVSKSETITVAMIEAEANLEVRRVMIDQYGKDRYIIDSNADLVNVDDYGKLYVKKITGDVDLMMVLVLNSTPEPDGTFREYWIRVDPTQYGGIKTAQAAVASTWRNKDGSLVFKTPEEYVLAQET